MLGGDKHNMLILSGNNYICHKSSSIKVSTSVSYMYVWRITVCILTSYPASMLLVIAGTLIWRVNDMRLIEKTINKSMCYLLTSHNIHTPTPSLDIEVVFLFKLNCAESWPQVTYLHVYKMRIHKLILG